MNINIWCTVSTSTTGTTQDLGETKEVESKKTALFAEQVRPAAQNRQLNKGKNLKKTPNIVE